MKRFLINVDTNWCGMDQTYAAIAKEATDLDELAEQLAYDNFSSFDCLTDIMEELFTLEEDEEYTDEQYDEASNVEGEYYSYNIEEWDETRDEEEWGWYELVYDGESNHV